MRDGKVVAADRAANSTATSWSAPWAARKQAAARDARARSAWHAGPRPGRPERQTRRGRARRPRGRDHRPCRPFRPWPDRNSCSAIFEGAARRIPTDRGDRAGRPHRRRPPDRRHLPALVDRREYRHPLDRGAAQRSAHLVATARCARRQLAGKINIRTPDVRNNILSLSGGNQQKALFARALGSDAEIVLMDDPMRGRRRHQAGGLRLDPRRGGRAAPSSGTRPRSTSSSTATMSTSSATAASSPTSAARAQRGEGDPVLVRGSRVTWPRVPSRTRPIADRRACRRAARFARAARVVADPDPDRHRLFEPAGDQLSRLQPDAQPGDPDRARDHRADVRHHVNDLDLSIGTFVGFVGCVTATAPQSG